MTAIDEMVSFCKSGTEIKIKIYQDKEFSIEINQPITMEELKNYPLVFVKEDYKMVINERENDG